MKALVTLLVSVVVLAAATNDQIRLVRQGKIVTEQPSSALATNVVKLLCSCSVHSTGYTVKAETWETILRSDSHIHLKFSQPRKLEVMIRPDTGPRSREEKSIDEILVPLPEGDWPQHIFAKAGTNVLSFTKYDPLALRKVAFDPVVRLKSVQPYAILTALDQKPE